ncbi:hypothetical protein EAG_01347 [Camponotus floridanus]|uniref:Uncharacterized protein n=1 Tax=Camponotus floridanus TaxID=104421 RepID=E2B0K4_CAMFO|nr:hypothetical protein EAG_01347 [Camponotus floridanus]
MPTLRWSFLGRLPSVARKYAKYHRLGTEPERSRNTKKGDGGRTAGPRTESRTWLTKERWATSPIMFPPAGDGPRPRPLLDLDSHRLARQTNDNDIQKRLLATAENPDNGAKNTLAGGRLGKEEDPEKDEDTAWPAGPVPKKPKYRRTLSPVDPGPLRKGNAVQQL